MTTKDIRWLQRFNHFNNAFSQLSAAVELSQQRSLTSLEQQGVIQAFEFTHELAWNTLKDFLVDRGHQNLYGSEDVTRQAFKAGLIENGDVWMEMIASRNLTSHTYDESTAQRIVSLIISNYFAEFVVFQTRMNQFKQEEAR